MTSTLLLPLDPALALYPSHSEFPIDEHAESRSNAPPPVPVDEWDQIFTGLRQRFPSASAGVLFCIHKLQQNSDLKLRDFKDEAALHRVPLSGRSYHSARVMLGLEQPTPPRARDSEAERSGVPGGNGALADARQPRASSTASPEDGPAIVALRRFQSETAAELDRLRSAIRRALEIIDEALAED